MLFVGTRVCDGFLVWRAARGDDDDDNVRAMIGTMTNATSNAMGGGRGRSLGTDNLSAMAAGGDAAIVLPGTLQLSSPGRHCR